MIVTRFSGSVQQPLIESFFPYYNKLCYLTNWLVILFAGQKRIAGSLGVRQFQAQLNAGTLDVNEYLVLNFQAVLSALDLSTYL